MHVSLVVASTVSDLLKRGSFSFSLTRTVVCYWVMFKILLLVYKALHVKAPSYFSGFLKAKPAGRDSLRSDSQDLLAVPRTMDRVWKGGS